MLEVNCKKHKHKNKQMKKQNPAMVVHVQNPSAQEAEAGETTQV